MARAHTQIVAQRKKEQEEDQRRQQELEAQAEAARWADVPVWKRGVLQRKEKEVCL